MKKEEFLSSLEQQLEETIAQVYRLQGAISAVKQQLTDEQSEAEPAAEAEVAEVAA